MRKQSRRKGHSLMPKLFLVLVTTGCLVDFTVGGFYRLLFSGQAHAAMEKNVGHYAQFLAAEIGSPPDTAKARLLSEKYSLRIRYQGPEGIWDSRPEPGMEKLQDKDLAESAFKTDSLELRPTGELGKVGWCRGKFCINVSKGQGQFLFVPDFRHLMENHVAYLALVILILSVVFAGAFFAIRRLLSPLKSLSAAVDRLGQGDLGHQVPVCSHDEFGDLAKSFNTMSSRLAALIKAREQLLLDVSHELRSPLTRIKVALELTPEGTNTDSIREDIREMETMIGEILEAARLDSVHGKLHLEEIDLGDMVGQSIKELSGRPPGAMLMGIGMDMGLDLGMPERQVETAGLRVHVDASRIRKVMTNVLDNACKFSQGQNAPIEIRILANEHSVTVRVRDHGTGIPSEEIPKLFQPFYRVDPSRSRETGGYGLGLSLCKRIMEAHGGSISMTSQVSTGTEVTLIFPKQLS